jgi:hypothetical protein
LDYFEVGIDQDSPEGEHGKHARERVGIVVARMLQ